ncbi:uncharacterized protein HMPREF1541_08374 [Cyphellophora europaea CBS 101466]|uniref:Protein kinase domain-containing protein n=1 Tax=Cyphellophora europaea (strain CBS 101466) TaxID=1220924 RepID=W2RNY4_CYPE1|nr:uncharacterized protein HMPREF1541_08374 [Cyphellophora europaea CBS 101466]ETN37383.1 hypothetical protein HMPREF1541_08374 [Cyphellophora europaea CBS 101466]
MIETCSPHHEGSSPVHLHSPHRLRYCDSRLAIGEIQRSLSRSPSKTADFRNSLRSISPSMGNVPANPSPLSPSRRSTSDLFSNSTTMASPFASRNPTSRQPRPSLRRSAQPSNNLRARTSPKSPSKKILSDSSDSGNSTPATLRKRSSTEADREQGLSNTIFGGSDKENSSSQEEGLGARHVYTRQEKRRSGGSLMSFVAPQSPMKRSEPMVLDQDEIKSPSAKRRSLHGPSSGLDFSIFESESPNNAYGSRAQEEGDWLRHASPATKFSTIPRRSTSLRKSTIQQRQAERSNMRFNQHLELENSWFDATPFAKVEKSLRMSLDNHLEPMSRESPFGAQGHLISASIHPAPPKGNSQVENAASTARHPLSRTITQSSSQSSITGDSPTHEPFHRPTRPASHDFSKSLPIGSTRPTPSRDSSENSSQGSFATPGTYKSARPLPAAFMSTGLISKKNRNINDPNAGLPRAHMPDTPCKRQSIMFPPDAKAGAGRNRVSFGTPATPAESQGIKPLPFAKSLGLFSTRQTKNGLLRKASFASIDFDEKASSQSPIQANASQSTNDSGFPPTPTKHFDEPSRGSSISPSPHHGRNLSVPALSGSQFPSKSVDEDSDSAMAGSPSANTGHKSSRELLEAGTSFTQGRLLKNMSSPTPLARSTLFQSTHRIPAVKHAKNVFPVTPLGNRPESRLSPHTPQESVFPPDPSGLTISGRGERPTTRNGLSTVVPATPTGPRDYFANFSNRPSLDLKTAHTKTLDGSLLARFEKVDLIGTGEFSQVYRVSQPPQSSPYHKIYSMSGRTTPRGSLQEYVWAVKKSRYPYAGVKDRQRKLKEVEALKVLGRSDHVIGFVDSWENENHLYIQTEFCEEGTLGSFVDQKGSRARLDDFRIWKIVLELSLGLQHIHEQGYVHLDLKPANVLISFEGVLKIADFGMASKLPAEPGIEGEGDREYIAPEILLGQYNRPADVFSLGLMMLEIAGNVVLPDNGTSWQKLRNGDWSDITTLSWDSESSVFSRDASGNPIDSPEITDADTAMDVADEGEKKRPSLPPARPGELTLPPPFMLDRAHPASLDNVVKRMMRPAPADRPLITEVLQEEGIRFVDARRRAGATVYEGNWGPADDILAEDAEMIDV